MLIIAMALEQLQVAPGVVVAAFSIVFGGIVLALAISFGVAGIDMAKRMLEQQKEKKQESAPGTCSISKGAEQCPIFTRRAS